MELPLGVPDRRLANRMPPLGEPSRAELTSIIVGSYQEMPGLSLRLAQAARLFGLRTRTCQIVMDDLVSAGQLCRTHDGQYVRPRR